MVSPVEGLSVWGVFDFAYASHEYSGWKDAAVSARFHHFAYPYFGISWYVVYMGVHSASAIPSQVAEVSLTAHSAADARFAVDDGYDERMACVGKIDDANHAAVANHAHFGLNAVDGTFVDDDVVVALRIVGVGHNFGLNVVVSVKGFCLVGVNGRGALKVFFYLAAQKLILPLQHVVFLGEAFVHLPEFDESLHVGLGFFDDGYSVVGCRKPYAAVVAVEAE